MTANPFLIVLNVLKAAIAKVAPELLEIADIREALSEIEAHRRDLETLPAEIAKIKAEKAKVEARLPRREAAAKPARHAVRLLEASLTKLRKSLDHNLKNMRLADDGGVICASLSDALGMKLPTTRKQRVEELKAEIAEVEKKIAAAIEGGKKAESLRKSDATRAANLGLKLEEAERKLSDRVNAGPEMIKLVRKTADHLNHRQAHRDRKAAERLAKATPAAAPVVEASKAPTDEQLRAWAELVGLDIASDDDLIAARDLHRQTA